MTDSNTKLAYPIEEAFALIGVSRTRGYPTTTVSLRSRQMRDFPVSDPRRLWLETCR